MRAVLLAAFAGAARATTVSVEPGESLPEGWKIKGPSANEQQVELTFAVKQQNVQKLHDALMRVSMPSSPDYGMHLSNEEVHALIAPDPKHLQAVLEFAKSFDTSATFATPNGDMVSMTVPVAVAEKMLSTKYEKLEHKDTGLSIDRALRGYSLPEDVASAVDFVSPTTHVPGVQRPIADKTGNLESGIGLNNPKNLHTLYNIKNTDIGKAAANKQAVTAFLRQYYNKDALHGFYKTWCVNASLTCGKGDPKTVGDGVTGLRPGVEAMLDIEYITAMGGNIESEFWGFKGQSPDNPANEPFMKWLAQAAQTSDADVPKIFSTSYGEDESSWSLAAATRLSTEFMKLGARGISLLFASGDNGANCKSGKFNPNEPASSPYVTAVGGTQPGLLHPQPGAERAAGLSSGGFSNYWPMPDYQKEAVAEYIKQSNFPDASKYSINITGRAFPDVAAQAMGFPVTMTGGISQIVAGTSCASPTFAGIVGLLNDQRLQAGKSTLGFLNPLFYSKAASFNDITTGSGGGCGFGAKGYPATKGWDAVTGLGTPDYSKLAQAVLELPAGRVAHSVAVVV